MKFIWSVAEAVAQWRWPWVTMSLVTVNFALFATFSRLDEMREQRLAERGVLALLYFHQHPYLTPKAPLDELVGCNRTECVVATAESSNIASVRYVNERTVRGLGRGDGVLVRQQQAELDMKVGELAQVTNQWRASNWGYVPDLPIGWGLITYPFVHSSWWHLLGNLGFLLLAGSRLEKVWGPALFGVFYVTAGIAAASAHKMFAWQSHVPLVGASGAVAGLLGAFAFWQVLALAQSGLPQPRLWRFAHVTVTATLLAWFGFELTRACISPWREGSVSHYAHVGGFVFGLLCVRLMPASMSVAHRHA